ncbi:MULTISPECIES: FHA domain-containing protein [unclassified Myxococcus]|uniref:FHA domain-containing protein n=1 Tax=Myxococcus TaxID=32 RepID=UPI001142ABB7|nr:MULTISPECIES: FHA domain-containing protein [unclassified Myxococcus]NOK06289.1 FHA domain-containing protein [Myxococcus xanthus]
MPILLTITQGLQQGRELTFEAAEVNIGRTSENDLVLHDHGVSRRHARIVLRDDKYFVADMGSSNGTVLNGGLLSGEQQLRDGDKIGVGPVEFTFVWVPPEGDEDATRPIRRGDPVPPLDPDATRPIRLNDPIPAESGIVLPEGHPTAQQPAVVPVRPGTAAVAKAEPGAGQTAAERARRRRELAGSQAGRLLLWWGQLSKPARLGVGAVGGGLVLALVGVLAVFFMPKGEGRASGVEPEDLDFEVISDSFGVGEGVTWENPDHKSFAFQFVTPTRAVAVVHYMASGISKEEVALVVNGVDVGWVPPDVNAVTERGLEQILPPSALKRGELNSIVFDNVRNPPGRDTWRVWNLRLEIIPVPELPQDELLAKARQYVATGARFYESRDVGAENLFKAWQQYRFAWVTLEALDTKPDIYQDVRFQLGQMATELDHKCSQLMLDFQRSVQYRNARTARAALQEMGRRFPTAEHRCHNLGLQLAYEHEL